MKNKEKLAILKDVATFAISAIENGVDIGYTFYGNSLSLCVFAPGPDYKVLEKVNIYLSPNKEDSEARNQITEFINLTIDKYYATR